ncbi:MAG: hypothetical protein H5T73_01035 [Actinobacteria bacterium]|nr:hypothetical protein [Actinomycetota bacterium]
MEGNLFPRDRHPALSRGKRECLWVFLLFLAVTFAFFWPAPLHLATRIIGDRYDAFLNCHIVARVASALPFRPGSMYQLGFFFPARDVLTYSEHLITLGLLALPAYRTTGNIVLSYNLLFLSGFFFSALTCYALVKYLTGSRLGGVAAGLFYAFCPYRFAQLGHIQIIFSPFLPLIPLYLFKYMETGRRRDLAFFALSFLAQSLVGWHHAVFCVLVFALFWLWHAAFSKGGGKWRRLSALLVSFLLMLAVLSAVAVPYLQTRNRLPDFNRPLEETVSFSLQAADLARVKDYNLLYGRLLPLAADALTSDEHILFPGLVVPLLALFILTRLIAQCLRRGGEDPAANGTGTGCGGPPSPVSHGRGGEGAAAATRTAADRRVPFFAVLLILCLVYMAGPKPGGITNPVYWLSFLGNRLSFIRVPTRFFVPASLCLAVLAAYGISHLAGHAGWASGGSLARRAFPALLVLLLLFEVASFRVPLFAAPRKDDLPPVYERLREEEEATIMELPAADLFDILYISNRRIYFVPVNPVKGYVERECTSLFLSILHGKRTVNGYSGYFPYQYNTAYIEAKGFPSARSVRLLASMGVDYVVWHWEWVEPERRQEYEERLSSTPGIEWAGDFGMQGLFRLLPQETAEIADVELQLVAPSVAPEREELNLGLIASNTSALPFMANVEEWQDFDAVFSDGSNCYSLRGRYRLPLYMDGGESVSIPLTLESTPPSGDYSLGITLTGGAFSGRALSSSISLRPASDLTGSGIIAGNITLSGEASLTIPSPGGLYPLVLQAENTGGIFWKAAWEDEKAQEYPYGLVFLGTNWSGEDNWRYSGHMPFLPCDLSPGQSASVPMVLRVPDAAGVYRLNLALFDFRYGMVSEPLSLELRVGEGAYAK